MTSLFPLLSKWKISLTASHNQRLIISGLLHFELTTPKIFHHDSALWRCTPSLNRKQCGGIEGKKEVGNFKQVLEFLSTNFYTIPAHSNS